jgi:hypothetical protein
MAGNGEAIRRRGVVVGGFLGVHGKLAVTREPEAEASLVL